jgi:hypothetical protein
MDLIIESDSGTQYTVIADLEDWLDDPKTIVKQVKLAVKHVEKEEG